MDKLKQLISVSLSQSTGIDEVMQDSRMTSFIDGKSMEIRLGLSSESAVEIINVGPIGSKIGNYDQVLTIKRNNKDKLNPRKIIQDISFSKSQPSGTGLLAAAGSLQSTMGSSAAIALQSVLRRAGVKTENNGMLNLLATWKSKAKESLDTNEKRRCEYLFREFSVGEKDYRFVRGNKEDTSNVDLNKVKSIITDFSQYLSGALINEPSLAPPEKELRIICNAFSCDVMERCNFEIEQPDWWDSSSINDRIKSWLSVLTELRTELRNRIGKKTQEYKDPQLEGQITKLRTMQDIYEIIKESKSLAESNKIIRDELGILKSKLAEENCNIMDMYKQLIDSSLFEALIGSLKSSIRQLSRSSQNFNTLHTLMASCRVIGIRPELFSDERRFALEVATSTLKNIDKELESTMRAIEDSDDTIGRWPQNDSTIGHVKDLVAVERKYALVDKFNETFFEYPHDNVRESSRRYANKIKAKIKDLVAAWDEKAIKEVVNMKSRRNESLLNLDIDAKVLTVDFSENLILMIHMLESLRELGLGDLVNPKVYQYLKEKRPLLKEGIQLNAIAEFYNSLSKMDSIMLQCHKPLLIDKIVALEDLIQNADKDIESKPHELHLFMKKATDIIQRFETENSSLKKTHSEIIGDFANLVNVDLITGNDEWKKTIKKAVTKIQGLTKSKPEKYVMVWTNTLSWQLLKVLSYQIKVNLLNISQYIPQFETNVKLMNNKIALYPTIPYIRSMLYSQIDMLINFPTSLSFFENWPRMIESLPAECGKYLNYAYAQIDSILKLLETKVQGLHRWIAISCLDSARISDNPRLNKGDIWKKIVETIKVNRRELERQEDFVDAGCIRLRISNFKIQIDERLTALLDAMITQIDSTMKADKDQVDAFLDTLTSTMNYQPQSTEELRQAWEAFDGVQVKMTDFLPALRNLEDKVYLIKTLGRVTPAAEETVERWRELEGRVKNFQNELKDKQEYMKAEISSKVETLRADLDKFNNKWLTVKMDEREALSRRIASEYLIALQGIAASWKDLKLQVERTRRDLAHFGIDDRGKLDTFDDINTDIEKENTNWQVYREFEESLRAIEEKKHVGNGKIAFEFQDLLVDWIGRLKVKKTREEIFIGKLIEEYQAIWPGLKMMIGESFQREHWNQMMHILGIKSVNPDALTFGHIIERSSIILQKIDDLKELAARAQGEVTIREAIQELDNWCAAAEFELMEYTDTFKRKVPLIKEWSEMMAKVGDNQALLQSVKDSKFFARFKDRITQFDKKMGGLDRYLSKINNVQRRWLYLEPIFNKGALPSEKPRFQNLNDKFAEIMRTVEKNKKISLLGEINGLDTTLSEILEQIEVCQSALNKFLEETRNRFPRFFFLGDDDLLEIMGQSENPAIIKLHLKKIFAGIFDVEFRQKSDGGMAISAMLSSVGESVNLKTEVPIVSNLESWLSALEKEMFVTLEDSLTQCVKDSQLSVAQFPGQILGLSKEIDFSHRVLDALEKNKLPEVKKHLDTFLDSLTKSKNKLQRVEQLKVKSLIMDVIHQVEVIDELLKQKVTDAKNWYWFKQLKYFISKKTKKCMTMMCRATFDYSYEYQGNPAKLVHTPLTDKCYLTLTQGMMLGFGGNPYGPAGTGKTESVKALGQCLARMVLVFNCDENLDYKSMGRIFVGLVKCGAWGCFDEFNRLIEEQLSAISQQIQIIQDAIREKRPHVQMMGKDVGVNFNAGIFVTLNPAGKGYGGRSKLPDNLKLLFRPVAMSRPDNELIGEVLLFSEGFKDAKRLSKKLVNIFTLCNQLLSKQQHYDWGLRALKVILTTSGELMQTTREKADKAVLSSPKLEDEILLKALNDNTASKLTSEDLVKFNDLIQDVLPDVLVPDIKQEDLIKAIKNTLNKNNYEVQDRQLNKIVQFYSALNQRIGVVIMGPSGAGKTTIWQVLREALQSMGTTVKLYVMNPKAISRNQLLGYMDPNTREFHNGVLTAAARKVIKEPTQVLNWIICDGDVDPKWIEALNSVLDDNHLLTLPTGERIAFGSNVNFIFETHDLKFASPATVSRMGMIYLNNDDVDINSLVAKWKKEKSVNEESQLNGFLRDYFEDIVRLISMYEENQIIKTTRMGSILSILQQVKECENKKKFGIGAMRGLLANFPPALRDEITSKLSSIVGEKLSFVNHFDEKQGAVVPYKTITSSDTKSLEKSKDICVLTPYVQANLAIIKKVIESGNTPVIVGPDGGGKNTIIKKAIANLATTIKVNTVELFCNSQTSAQQVIALLLEACAKSTTATGPILRPKDCSKLIVYLRDVNLAKPDEYNSIELVSFLQQLHSHRGFYDEELEFTQLDKSVQFVVSMNPSSDIGRNEISTRLTACTHILYIDHPSKDDMKVIVKEIVDETFSKSQTISALIKSKPSFVDQVTGFLLELFAFVKSSFTPESQKHYNFTPKDIGSILENTLTYEVETVDEISFCLLAEAAMTFRTRLVKQEEISKYDSSVRKFSQSLPLNGVKDTVFTALVKKDQILSKITTSGYLELLSRSLVGYQRENADADLVFTDQTVELVQIVDKVISRPGGKTILMGSSGSGRKLLTHFVCFMLNIELETFSPSKSYNLKEFRKELRRMLEIAGFQGKRICMYLENHHILEPRFMEDINSLLSANQIQGLFRVEEVESALKDQVDELRNEFFGQSVFECFLLRIKKNFRAVFSLDPKESMFEKYLTDNPALLKKCRPVWVQPLSSDTLRKIATARLQDFFREKMGSELNPELVESLVEIHRDLGSCPRTLFAAVDLSRQLMESRMIKLKSKTGHLESGVKTIDATNTFVDQLLASTAELKKDLKVKQDEAERFLQKIQQTYESASDQKREAEEIKEYLQKEEEKTMDKRATIKEELDRVQPIVDAAMKSVGNIPKNYISELKSFANPPPAVDDVFQALSKLNQEGGYSWGTMKKSLTSDTYFKQILNIDARSNLHVRKEVSVFISKNPSSFDKQSIFRVSQAAAPVADYIKALLQLGETYDKIRPYEDQLKDVDSKLAFSRERLAKTESELAHIDEKVAELKVTFGKTTAEGEMLRIEVTKAEEKIKKASTLLEKLSDESSRWQSSLSEINSGLRDVPFHSLLAAAFISYLANKDEAVRAAKLKNWQAMLKVPHFSLVDFLSDESEVLEFVSEGLPGDQLSVENALVALHGSQSSLIIDPNYALSQWLINRLKKDKQVEVVSSQEKKMVSILELGIRFGKTLIVNEVDGVESLFVNILRKDLKKQGPRLVVSIGEKVVDWSDQFQLILMSRNHSIKLEPNMSALVNTVKNLVTTKGLEDKLLSLIINDQKPGLESKKKECLEQERFLKIEIAKLEKKLLEELAESTGNILDNVSLLNSLDETKTKSIQISESLQESSKLKASLEKERNVYQPHAAVGTQVFLKLKDLQTMNNMYCFSLMEFTKVFKTNLKSAKGTTDPKELIKLLNVSLFKETYHRFSLAMQKKDKLALALHLLTCCPGVFMESEYDFLLDRLEVAETKMSLPSWANESSLPLLCKFNTVFPNVVKGLKFEKDEWRQWYSSPECEKTFPTTAILRPVQRVIMVKIFREDRFLSALEDFACQSIGLSNINEGVTSIPVIYDLEPGVEMPLLFVTSVGSDPSNEIEEFAQAKVGREKFIQISMGGGQNEVALKTLEECAAKGDWLCLKNLHLVPNFLTSLEKTLNNTQITEGFKLFLTTEEHPKFPVVLLESCFKLSYEAPPGLKMNVERVFATLTAPNFKQLSPEEGRLTFLLAYFHALLQERRTYIPQGWSKFYEFSLSDFKSGHLILETIMSEKKNVDWAGLYGLFENAIYGGRIDRVVDLDVLRAYLETIFNEKTLKTGQLKGGITAPLSNELKDHLKVIATLPEVNKPSLFGLPDIFQQSVQRLSVQNTLNDLKSLDSVALTSSDQSAMKHLTSASPYLVLWKKYYTKLMSLPEISKPIEALSSEIVENIVQQEVNKRIKIMHRVNSYFADLEKVLDGRGSLTSGLEKFAIALAQNKLPPVMVEIWDGTDYPDEWIRIIGRKTGLLKNWVVALNQKTLYDDRLPLGVFLEPEILLNTLRQKTCRQIKKPLDDLEINVTFGEDALNDSLFSFKIADVVLEGGRMSRGSIEASNNVSEREKVDLVTIGFVEKGKGNLPLKTVELPLYLTNSKEEMLLRMKVPCAGDKNEVLLAGCSFSI